MNRIYTVYLGYSKTNSNEIVYVGTTTQKPKDRFRWHKYNGKDLRFVVVGQFDNSDNMLKKECELIQKYKPRLNKIKHREQNLNVKLTEKELGKRKGRSEWCQKCLRRRVRKGYTYCFWCT